MSDRSPDRSPDGAPRWRSVKSGLARLARQRLVQFLVLGGALFALAPSSADDDQRVFVSAARVDAVARQEGRRDRTGKGEARLRADATARLVEDELLIREARRLGLDQDDYILRQRLVQKALFLAEDLGGAGRAISDAELRRSYAEHRAEYVEEQLTFTQVFAHDRDHLTALRDEVIAYAAANPDRVPPFGDPLPLPRRATVSAETLRYEWGEELLTALRAAPLGTWSQPLPSRRGFHLVLVQRRAREALPFEEAKGRVELALVAERRRAAVADFLERARPRYRIAVEGQAAPPPLALGRTAIRTAPSVED